MISTNGSKAMLADFTAACKGREDIAALKKEVNAFASSFPMPGWDTKSMKYNSIEMDI